jgi:hypothetical protein
MDFELISRKNELCRGFIRYAFEKLKQDNDPSRNFDCVLEDVYDGEIYACITEFFCDMIYDAYEFSFVDYCNQHGGGFEDCVGYLQDFVDGITDFEFLRVCMDDPNEITGIGIDVNNYYVVDVVPEE